jgi:hypothetical protein
VRKIAVIGLIVLGLGALAVIVPASASQNAQSGPRWAARHAQAAKNVAPNAAGDVFTANDNFSSRTLNHFGNAANGSAIAETWLESGLDADLNAKNAQGFARVILLPKALRASVRVELRGTTATGDDALVARSGTVNSSGKLTVQVATPEITLATDPRCSFYQLVTVSIRWSDNRLSTIVFDTPLSFTPGPTACTPPPPPA